MSLELGATTPTREQFAALDRTVVPSISVSTPALRTPTKLYRDHCLPCSADSSRTVPGRLPASLR